MAGDDLLAKARAALPASAPVVLAGPVLRRLTRKSVAVWIATSNPEANITVTVGPEAAFPSGAASREQRVTRVLPGLGVTVVDVDAPLGGSYAAGTEYTYSVTVSSETMIGSFTGLPKSLGSPGLRLAHGSCRKVHGMGSDGLAILDQTDWSTGERPHLLLMTGDQIYADDVPDAFAALVRVLADWLTGGWRNGPHGCGLGAFPADPVGGREDYCKRQLGFTGDLMRNHLLSFPEYCAMYLLVWSEGLCPKDSQWWSGLGCPDGVDPQAWKDEIGRLVQFRADLEGVSAVLANVPSYMILDDHEVTDDWNLDQLWCENVYSRDPARAVITNALAAYLLFQHWGNVPERFATPTSAEAKALAAVSRRTLAQCDPDSIVAAPLLGLPPKRLSLPAGPLRPAAGDGKPEGVLWTYSVPDLPVRVHVLDERTERGFDVAGRTMRIWHSESAEHSALARMLPLPLGNKPPVTVVVAPGPILGFDAVEHFVQPLGALFGKVTRRRSVDTYLDLESWSWHGTAFLAMLRRLTELAPTVVLSGDVHYGQARSVDWTPEASTVPLQVLQLTCSSFRNAELKTYVLGAYGDLFLRMGMLGQRDFVVLRNGDLIKDPDFTRAEKPLPWQDLYDLQTRALGVLRDTGGDRLLPEGLAQVCTTVDLTKRDAVSFCDLIDYHSGLTDREVKKIGDEAGTLWDGERSIKNLEAIRSNMRDRVGRAISGATQAAVVTLTASSGDSVSHTVQQETRATSSSGAVDQTVVSHTFPSPAAGGPAGAAS